MGNILKQSSAVGDYILMNPQAGLQCLIRCKIYLGPYKHVRSLVNKYFKSFSRSKLFIDKHDLRKLTIYTPIDGKEEIIFSSFENSKRLNVYEVLTAIIIYSSSAVREKSELLFSIYDFDGSKSISKDEIVILFTTLMRSVSTMIKIPLHKYINPNVIAEYCYKFAGNYSNEQITFLEFFNLVQVQPLLTQLMEKFSQEEIKEPVLPRGRQFKSFDTQRNLENSGAYHSSFLKNSAPNRLRRPVEAFMELRSIFLSNCKLKKTITVSRLYSEFSSSKNFVNDADYIYNLFHFQLNRELDFAQVVDLLNRNVRKSSLLVKKKSLSVPKAGKEISVTTPNEVKTERRSLSYKKTRVLNQIFQKYDKNHDGFIDIKELKIGLGEIFDKKTIRSLFEAYVPYGKDKLDLEHFIKLFSPNDVEVNQDILKSFNKLKTRRFSATHYN